MKSTFIKNQFISCLWMFFVCFTCLCQNARIDSLKSDLKTNPKNKFWTYNELAWQFTSVSLDSLNHYNNISKKIAKSELEKRNTELLDAVILLYSQKIEEANTKVSSLINDFDKLKDYKSLGSAYNLQAKIYNIIGDFERSEKSMYNALINTKKTKNKKLILKSYINYGSTLMQNNKLDKGIEYLNESEKYASSDDYYERGIIYQNLSRIFLEKKVYNKSISNGLKSIENLKKAKASFFYFDAYLTLSDVYIKIKNFKEAEIFINQAYSEIKNNYDKSNVQFIDAQLQISKADYNKARSLVQQSIEIDKEENPSKLGEDYLLLAEIEFYSKNYQKTNELIDKAINIFKLNQENSNLIIAYDLQFKNFFKLSSNTKLFENYTEYQKIKDTIQFENQKQAVFDFQTKYETAEKETKIKTQQLQLEKEKTNRNLAISGILFVVLLSGGGWLIYRNKQKQKEKQLEYEINNLNNDINEMELQTLNQQLDPHEITNYIQSVSGQILRKDEKLYNQLINLWDITNIVLNHKEITSYVNTEIENLEKYLTFQQEIVHPKFEFNITNKLKDDKIKIPRLLLRNLAGNAIKHGLKGIEGKIDIDIFEQDNIINIHVQDNGKGFEKNKLGKGIGTSTYDNIFTKLNLKNKEKAIIEINNLNQGVLVKVSIPKNYNFMN